MGRIGLDLDSLDDFMTRLLKYLCHSINSRKQSLRPYCGNKAALMLSMGRVLGGYGCEPSSAKENVG